MIPSKDDAKMQMKHHDYLNNPELARVLILPDSEEES